jgi:hypothetical protein
MPEHEQHASTVRVFFDCAIIERVLSLRGAREKVRGRPGLVASVEDPGLVTGMVAGV